VDAIAALRGLRLDEGFLHRMRALRRAEPLERDDLLLRIDARQRRHARAHRLAVDMDRAGAALAEPAAEAWPLEREIVAQRIEKRHRRVIDHDRDWAAIDGERFPFGHGRPPCSYETLCRGLFRTGSVYQCGGRRTTERRAGNISARVSAAAGRATPASA